MKKLLIILLFTSLILTCTYASPSEVDINGVEFKLPFKYQGGELKDNEYELKDTFSIECIDDNVPTAIGLWATESESSEDITIGYHPVRHFCQYNEYINAYHSHAYFVSGESAYEISWTGKQIDEDIEKLINNTPKSKIDADTFYTVLDKSVDIYKLQKIDKLNQEAEYNYLEAKYQFQSSQQKAPDDTRFKEILTTYHNK